MPSSKSLSSSVFRGVASRRAAKNDPSRRLNPPWVFAETDGMEHLLSISLGLGLAAAAGFRVFVPLLVLSAASYTGHLELSSGMEWVGTLPALVAFATATVLEIAAYYIPWLDHLFDALAAPAAVVAGAILTASALTDMDPLLKWSMAIIGGGAVAGAVKGTTAITRGASTLTTGGLGNPILSTFEAAVSFVLSLLAVALPLIALALVVLAAVAVAKWVSGKSRRPAGAANPP